MPPKPWSSSRISWPRSRRCRRSLQRLWRRGRRASTWRAGRRIRRRRSGAHQKLAYHRNSQERTLFIIVCIINVIKAHDINFRGFLFLNENHQLETLQNEQKHPGSSTWEGHMEVIRRLPWSYLLGFGNF